MVTWRSVRSEILALTGLLLRSSDRLHQKVKQSSQGLTASSATVTIYVNYPVRHPRRHLPFRTSPREWMFHPLCNRSSLLATPLRSPRVRGSLHTDILSPFRVQLRMMERNKRIE
jgi:hypothetical protein